jgi:hypothetical protein
MITAVGRWGFVTNYIISEFEVLLKHSTRGTVGSHKKPQDITASNTSNNGNKHLQKYKPESLIKCSDSSKI